MRRVPLRRGRFLAPRTKRRTQSTRRMHDIRPALNERCNGECERCGFPLDILDDGTYVFDAHHRQRRSEGGADSLENTVACHHSCHVLHRKSIHQDVAQATADGFLVPSWSDPERVAILYKGVLSWLSKDGGVRPVTTFDYEPIRDDLPPDEAQLAAEIDGETAANHFNGAW